MRQFLLYIVCLGLSIPGLSGCIAQIRNGDQIAADPYLTYATPERTTEEFLQLEPTEARLALENPTTAAEWNDRAVLDARLQQLDAAETAFEKSIELEPQTPLAYYNLGRLYTLLGEDARARQIYVRLVQKGAVPGERLYQRATQMSGENRRGEARWIMEALASIVAQPASIDAALWLAGDAIHALDYARARDYYDRVLAKNPLEPRALFGRGYISYLAEDWPAAAHLLGLALKHNSREPTLPYFLTRALFEQERYSEALKIVRSVQKPDLNLLSLHGRIRLILDYRADLSDLLAQARSGDRDRLRQIWYGSEEHRDLPELGSEFEFLY